MSNNYASNTVFLFGGGIAGNNVVPPHDILEMLAGITCVKFQTKTSVIE